MIKKIYNEFNKFFIKSNMKSSYLDYQLITQRNFSAIVALFVALFNGLLLLPDLILIDKDNEKLIILILRLIYSSLLIGFYANIKKFRSFGHFSFVVTFLELFEVFIFLFVLSKYNPPDFMIQSMGMMIINIVIFLFPNRWFNMLFVSILSTSGFLIYSYIKLNPSDFMTGMIYLIISIALCSIFAFNLDKHQYNEFIAKNELIRINSTDQLTNAFNRYKLIEEFDKWEKYCRRYNLPMSLILFDIDKFKNVNDDNGHILADSVLVELVTLIVGQLRSSDVLARWGGDEFILLLPNTAVSDAANICERVRKTIEEFSFTNSIKITCSFGITGMKADSNLDSMLEEADKTMYIAKNLGGNSIKFQNSVNSLT
jgi:diguanylate cyclase (GGDEF)-like protein